MPETISPQITLSNISLDDLIRQNLQVPERTTTPTEFNPYSYAAGVDNDPRDEQAVFTEFEKDLQDNRPYYYLAAKYGEEFVEVFSDKDDDGVGIGF